MAAPPAGCSWIAVEHVTAVVAFFIFHPFVLLLQHRDGSQAMNFNLDPFDVSLIVVAALGSFAGVAFQTKGYQLADPGKAAMFTYLEIPVAYFLQHMFTKEHITVGAVYGALFVFVSCIVSVVEELGSQDEEEERIRLMDMAYHPSLLM